MIWRFEFKSRYVRDEAACNILRQDAHSHVLRSSKPFIPTGVNKWVPAFPGGISFGDCRRGSRMAWLPVTLYGSPPLNAYSLLLC
jgi:hypothetical protein